WTLDPRSFVVRAGDIIRDNGYQVNVTKIILHEKFVPGQYYNDIAILTLENEVQPLNRPVCLPSPELSIRNLTGANTTLLGWGHTSYGKHKCVLPSLLLSLKNALQLMTNQLFSPCVSINEQQKKET
ncbi:hypothetical protein AVEN_213536-1, partial [Araneus ventricosus]